MPVVVVVFYRTEKEGRDGIVWRRWSFARFHRLPATGEYLELWLPIDTCHAWYRVDLVVQTQLRGGTATEPPPRVYVTRARKHDAIETAAVSSIR
jgi:hypothetical protein